MMLRCLKCYGELGTGFNCMKCGTKHWYNWETKELKLWYDPNKYFEYRATNIPKEDSTNAIPD